MRHEPASDVLSTRAGGVYRQHSQGGALGLQVAPDCPEFVPASRKNQRLRARCQELPRRESGPLERLLSTLKHCKCSRLALDSVQLVLRSCSLWLEVSDRTVVHCA